MTIELTEAQVQFLKTLWVELEEWEYDDSPTEGQASGLSDILRLTEEDKRELLAPGVARRKAAMDAMHALRADWERQERELRNRQDTAYANTLSAIERASSLSAMSEDQKIEFMEAECRQMRLAR